MEQTIKYNFTNCTDCPHMNIDRGHGYTAERCCHKKWEATTSKTQIPWDCPLLDENKSKTKEDILSESRNKDQARWDEWLDPIKHGLSEVGAKFISMDTEIDSFGGVEFVIEGGKSEDIAKVFYEKLFALMRTVGSESGIYKGMEFSFSRPAQR